MPVLQKLHWLPVSARIKYKISMITSKIRQTGFPEYQFSQLRLHGSFALLKQTYSMFLRPNPHLTTSPAELTTTPHPLYGTVYRLNYKHSRWRQLPGHLLNTSNDASSLRPSPNDHESIPRIRVDSKNFDARRVINSCTSDKFVHR